ncbi:MAG TPA: DUF6438 domain-containing protein [Polyangiaceae bacterium]|jgi:hypothetical protein
MLPARARTTRALLGLVLVTLLATAGCRKRQKTTDTIGIDQPHPPELLPGHELLATLERSGCFGECPVYRLSVYRDGTVVYLGTRWVKVLGRQQYNISAERVAALEGAFARSGFMQMPDYDRVEGTDDDWAHLSYRRGSFMHRVRHYHGDQSAPPLLSTLEDDFDRAAESGRFVGGAAPTGALQLSAPASPSASPPPSSSAGAVPRPSAGAPASGATASAARANAPAASATASSKPRSGTPEMAPETQE